jgi:CheY-like chemotaxis protein
MAAADTTSVTRTLLLADGNATIQRVVELTFAHEKLRVVPVSDGAAAIEAIKRSPPDLVLADIAMAGQSGYDVAAFVRSQPGLSAVPVLLLAGAFERVDQARARSAGAAGVLSKPFDPAVLVARVNELLSPQPQAPSSFSSHSPSESPSPSPSPAPALSPSPVQSEPEVPHQAAGWATGFSNAAESAASPAPDQTARSASERDRYFAELDQAFAALSQNPRRPFAVDGADADGPAAQAAVESEAPNTQSSGAEDLAAGASPTHSRVPLTDAFAAMLDAERTGVPIETLWPAPSGDAQPSASVGADAKPAASHATDRPEQAAAGLASTDLEHLADLVARRVLEQLTDRVVRETVGDIVSATAERLVREEIDRIKRHIK